MAIYELRITSTDRPGFPPGPWMSLDFMSLAILAQLELEAIGVASEIVQVRS